MCKQKKKIYIFSASRINYENALSCFLTGRTKICYQLSIQLKFFQGNETFMGQNTYKQFMFSTYVNEGVKPKNSYWRPLRKARFRWCRNGSNGIGTSLICKETRFRVWSPRRKVPSAMTPPPLNPIYRTFLVGDIVDIFSGHTGDFMTKVLLDTWALRDR